MPTVDAPDWQRVVQTVTTTGAVPDAPDWQRIVVGPGGQPAGPLQGGGILTPYYLRGFYGITCDPEVATQTVGHTQGQIAFVIFSALATFTANFIWAIVGGTGGLTPNENFVGIYDSGQATPSTLTLLGKSAVGACDTAFATTGVKKIAISPGVACTAGQNYMLAFLNNGASPSFPLSETSPSSGLAVNPEGLTFPYRSISTATFTALPSSIAFSALTLSYPVWLFYVTQT